MNIIFYERQKINELSGLLRDLRDNQLAQVESALQDCILAMDPNVANHGHVYPVIEQLRAELQDVNQAFAGNLTFLAVLDDKYAAVENKNQRAIEALLSNMALYDGQETESEPIPDMAVVVNRTLRYLLDIFVQGYVEQIEPIPVAPYGFTGSPSYFVSDVTDRTIISKYLTKLDFSFLSSLPQVYDFFDFGELNLLVIKKLPLAAKWETTIPNEEGLYPFPETRVIPTVPPFTKPVMVDGRAGEDVLTSIMTNNKSFMQGWDMDFHTSDKIEDVVIKPVSLTEKVAQTPDNIASLENSMEKPSSVTEKYMAGGNFNLDEMTGAVASVTGKETVNPDSTVLDNIAMSASVTGKQTVNPEHNKTFDSMIETAATVTSKQSVSSEDSKPLDGITSSASVTGKETVNPDSTVLDNIAASASVTNKQTVNPEHNKPFDSMSETVATVTSKQTVSPGDSQPLDGIASSASVTGKETINPDSTVLDNIAASASVTNKQTVNPEHNKPFDSMTETVASVTSKQTVSPGDSKSLDGIASAASVTSKQALHAVTPVEMLAANAAAITAKQAETTDANNSLVQGAVIAPSVTAKQESETDDNAETENTMAKSRSATVKQDLNPMYEIENVNVAAQPITTKQTLSADRDTHLATGVVIPPLVTAKQTSTPDYPQTITDNAKKGATVTQKQDFVTVAQLQNRIVKSYVITKKQVVLADSDNNLRDVTVAERIQAAKDGQIEPDQEGLNILAAMKVSGSTLFRHLSNRTQAVRHFRKVRDFHFLEDETDYSLGLLDAKKYKKTAKETIKEDVTEKGLRDLVLSSHSKTISPAQFVEGVVDELQVKQVEIRKTLHWSEEACNQFLDDLYDFSQAPHLKTDKMIIAQTYAAIIGYITSNAAKGTTAKSNNDREKSQADQPHDTLQETVNPLRRESMKLSDANAVAAELLLTHVANKTVSAALAGMVYPAALMEPNDIFAHEADIFQKSCARYESLGGASSVFSLDSLQMPQGLRAITEKDLEEKTVRHIERLSVGLAANTLVSAMAGVYPAQYVTIQSALPAFTGFTSPIASQNAQAVQADQNKALAKQAASAKALNTAAPGGIENQDELRSLAVVRKQNTAEGFGVEYEATTATPSDLLVDSLGSSALGFIGGLLLSREDDLEDKFMRIARLAPHTYEEVIKNTYQSGVIQQAKQLADRGDIFRILSGGKATVANLSSVSACLT